MQILAVHGGGSLIQNLPDAVGNARHGGTSTGYGQIAVSIDPGHRISALIDTDLVVPAHHHQAVDEHPGFVATGRDEDGVLQSMEAIGDRFVVGVQWHPETAGDKGLFRGVVAAARSALT